jgi:hypothetical protein
VNGSPQGGSAWPDFFLVGAPKCGTTAMAQYLGQHPEIGMCAQKETQYFAGPELWSRFGLKGSSRPFTHDEYGALFAGTETARRVGEASVWYLYSREAPEEIRRSVPSADIIVMLRNPMEMLPSLHSQFVFVGIEPVDDFATALALDQEREQNGAPKGFPPTSYRAAARYTEQLERYLRTFGPDRVHVIVYDDFRDDTLGAYQATCRFLGVDPGFVPVMEVVNASKRVRSGALRGLVRTPPEPLRKAVRAVSTQGLRRRAGTALIRWNSRGAERDPVPESVQESLRPLVAHEVAELRRLLGVELEAWNS